MATHAPLKTAFEKWQDGINNAVGDSRWDAYDNELRTAVSEFDQHLHSTPGYRQLDWLLISPCSGLNPVHLIRSGEPSPCKLAWLAMPALRPFSRIVKVVN